MGLDCDLFEKPPDQRHILACPAYVQKLGLMSNIDITSQGIEKSLQFLYVMLIRNRRPGKKIIVQVRM